MDQRSNDAASVGPVPAEKVAIRFAAAVGATVPIDVEGLLRSLADVTVTRLPVSADAIASAIKPPGRPQVFLNEGPSPRRLRFTNAHELGHIVIPWHVGTIISHTDPDKWSRRLRESEIEGEANAFAAELLMPRPWLRRAISEVPRDRLGGHVSGRADVSLEASLIRIVSLLPDGHGMAMLDQSGTVVRAAKSPGSALHLPLKGERYEPPSNRLVNVAEESVGRHRILWIWARTDLAQSSDVAQRPSSEILDGMMIDLGVSPEEGHHLRQSLAGVVGAADSSTRAAGDEEFTSFLIQRLSSKAEFQALQGHPAFEALVHARQEEMLARRAKRAARPA